jgi:hypothetical protein
MSESGEKVHNKAFTAILCARVGSIGRELSEASGPQVKVLSRHILDCVGGLEKLARSLAEINDESHRTGVQEGQQSPVPPRPRFLN